MVTTNITNNTVLSYCQSTLSKVPQYQQIYFAVLFGLNALFATMFNLCICIVFTRYRSLRNPSDIHLLSLAAGDLIIGAVLSPISILQVISENYQNCVINKIGAFLVGLLAISAVTLMMISYDRYLHLCKLDAYSAFMTKRKLTIMLVIPWLSPLILIASKFINKQVYTWTILLMFSIVYTVLISSYMRLALKLSSRQMSCNQNIKKLHQRNIKAVHLIFLLMLSLILLTLGTGLYRIFMTIDFYLRDGLHWYQENEATIMACGQVLFQFNSTVNPILYFATHAKLRSAIIKTFLRVRRVHPQIA